MTVTDHNPKNKFSIAIFLFFAFCIAFVAQTCHAQITVSSFQKIDADTVTRELQLSPVNTFGNFQVILIIIDSDNTGTLSFAVAPAGAIYPIRSTAQTYAATDGKIYVTIQSGVRNLFYKASTSSGNSFSITD